MITKEDTVQIMDLYSECMGPAMGTFLESNTWSMYNEDYVHIAAQLVAIANKWAWPL